MNNVILSQAAGGLPARPLLALLAGAALLAPVGCFSPVEEKQITVKASNDPLFYPRSVLQRYANGQPMGSEVTGFPAMVAELRKTDAKRADILEKGLADLQAAPASGRKAIAKDLLTQLAPSML